MTNVRANMVLRAPLEIGMLVADWQFGTEVEERVEECWKDAERRSSGRLYNGKLFTVKTVNPGIILGRFVDYKYYFAQRALPDLDLGIQPVGVSGVTYDVSAPSMVLLGQRSSDVTTYADALELVPSGNLSDRFTGPDGAPDPVRELRAELSEETSLGHESIIAAETLGLVYDNQEGIYDIVAALGVKVSGVSPSANREYRELTFLDIKEARQRLEAAPRCVPTSLAALGLFEEHDI
ncbi:MAG: hypothetical protein KDD44_03535 [Bdellovibrionales bacterium]|nr:hypothetical protein [Bdellovibrionales bacterium]